MVLGLDVKVWHDNGAYTPYGIIVPIITSTGCWGPTSQAPIAVSSGASTPTRSSSRPTAGRVDHGGVRDGAHDGCDRGAPRQGPRRRAQADFILPEEMPYDHGLMFQDGRPLKYDSGDFPASWPRPRRSWAGTTSRHTGRRPRPRGARWAWGSAATSKGRGRQAL
ncbi:MAG: hypothetical protein M9923_04635 [Phycicoccus sp.]|nr:hypothetical protein [Phycicoccus sp.]MCO5302490.1 hypothetical protein [Phycicoccus sp.]